MGKWKLEIWNRNLSIITLDQKWFCKFVNFTARYARDAEYAEGKSIFFSAERAEKKKQSHSDTETPTAI